MEQLTRVELDIQAVEVALANLAASAGALLAGEAEYELALDVAEMRSALVRLQGRLAEATCAALPVAA